MADAYTGVAALDFDQNAWDLKSYFAFRPENYFDAVADVQSTNQTANGSAVIFTITSDLAVASTALSESVDVNAVPMADTQVTLTLAEYGNAVITTALARGTSFIPLDPIMANVIGYNAGVSVDTLARDALKGGSNIRYSGQASSRNTVIPTDTLTGNNARRAVAELRGANVPTIGGLYAAFIHPDVSYDFRGANGGANWRDPHTYSQPDEIWQGEIGAFEGARFIETPRAPVFADAGSSTTLTDVYRTIWTGRQALAKAFSHSDGNGPSPRTVPGPVTDKLRRFVPMGWYWLGAYGRFREAAIRAVESASSIGTNA